MQTTRKRWPFCFCLVVEKQLSVEERLFVPDKLSTLAIQENLRASSFVKMFAQLFSSFCSHSVLYLQGFDIWMAISITSEASKLSNHFQRKLRILKLTFVRALQFTVFLDDHYWLQPIFCLRSGQKKALEGVNVDAPYSHYP